MGSRRGNPGDDPEEGDMEMYILIIAVLGICIIHEMED